MGRFVYVKNSNLERRSAGDLRLFGSERAVEFRPKLRRQLADATRKDQTGRQRLCSHLLDGIEEVKSARNEQ